MSSAPTADESMYQETPEWERIPDGMRHLDVPDVATDMSDRVYLLTRHDQGVWVYEPDGTFAKSWVSDRIGNGAHGIQVGPDGSVWIIDFNESFVAKHSNDGEVLFVLGGPEEASDTGYDDQSSYWDGLRSIERGAGPFNRPTNLAFAPDGTFFVSDGYGNARVHRFNEDAELIDSWGEPGSEPGQFRNPHHVSVDSDGRVIVSDRENCRIQIFDIDGRLIDIIDDLRRPAAAAPTVDGYLAVVESEVQPGHHFPFRGHFDRFVPSRLSVFDAGGDLVFRTEIRTGPPLTSAAGQPGEEIDASTETLVKVAAPNGLAVDTAGTIYIAEVPYAMYNHRTPGGIGEEHEALHRFERAA